MICNVLSTVPGNCIPRPQQNNQLFRVASGCACVLCCQLGCPDLQALPLLLESRGQGEGRVIMHRMRKIAPGLHGL